MRWNANKLRAGYIVRKRITNEINSSVLDKGNGTNPRTKNLVQLLTVRMFEVRTADNEHERTKRSDDENSKEGVSTRAEEEGAKIRNKQN